MIVVCNFTPVVRAGYRIGVPAAGHYREMLNTDSGALWRQQCRQSGRRRGRAVPMHGQA